jgi:hypothetical protein
MKHYPTMTITKNIRLFVAYKQLCKNYSNLDKHVLMDTNYSKFIRYVKTDEKVCQNGNRYFTKKIYNYDESIKSNSYAADTSLTKVIKSLNPTINIFNFNPSAEETIKMYGENSNYLYVYHDRFIILNVKTCKTELNKLIDFISTTEEKIFDDIFAKIRTAVQQLPLRKNISHFNDNWYHEFMHKKRVFAGIYAFFA